MSTGMNNTTDENKNLSPISKNTRIITALVCLLPVIAGILLYPQFPEQMVTHWDAQGNPNGWQNKFVAAIVLPGILFLLQLAMPWLIKADPKNQNLNPKITNLICWIIPAVSMFCSFSTICAGLGIDPRVELAAPVLAGLLFVVIGNYLPKMSQSYTVGIKLPWTLESQENWNRTHRLAGFLWVIGGIVVIISAFFPFRATAFLIVLITVTLVPVIYSYGLYRRGI